MLEYKDSSVRIQDAAKMSSEELDGKIIIGKFVEKDKEEFTDNLRNLNQKVREEKIGRAPEDWSLS
jgi:2-oxoglutarate ferredoxin oxidoreductase subunit beta